jgi:hypothetical protein
MTETVISEIQTDLARIGEKDIRRVERNFGAIRADETPLGTIHDADLKRMYALSKLYDHESDQALLDSAAKADSMEEAAELQRKAFRLQALERIARSLFWAGARDAIGLSAWDRSITVGLRDDWMLVSSPAKAAGDHIVEILGGIVRPQE